MLQRKSHNIIANTDNSHQMTQLNNTMNNAINQKAANIVGISTQKNGSKDSRKEKVRNNVAFQQKASGSEQQSQIDNLEQPKKQSVVSGYTSVLPSMNKIASKSNKSLRIVLWEKNAEFGNPQLITTKQTRNKQSQRKTCRTFQLYTQPNQPQYLNTTNFNDLSQTFKNNIYHQSQDKQNISSNHKNQRYLKIVTFHDKPSIRNITQQNTHSSHHQFNNRKMSIKTQDKQLIAVKIQSNSVSVDDKNKKIEKHKNNNSIQCTITKSILGNNEENKQRKIKWTPFKKCQMSVQYNNSTFLSHLSTAKKNIAEENNTHAEQLIKRQNQLNHLTKLKSDLDKFLSNDRLITNLKLKHTEYIDRYFYSFESQIINCNTSPLNQPQPINPLLDKTPISK